MARQELWVGGYTPRTQVTLREFWNDSLATRSSRRLTFFLLYVSEGIPLGFTATVIATHMRRDGLDPDVIGWYVGSLYLPWAFKWLFGPVVDTGEGGIES